MAKNNGKFILFLLICILVVSFGLLLGGCKYQPSNKKIGTDSSLHSKQASNTKIDSKGKIELLCLMYHNVVGDKQKQGAYEVRESTIERDFAELEKMGYKCVNSKQLFDIVDGKKSGKYVMITFDDGFYGVYKYVPRLLEKYNMKCIVSVVGEFMDKQDKQDKQSVKTRCSYMNTQEVATLAKNKRVEIAHHSYNLHHIGGGKRGVKMLPNESNAEYKSRFLTDTQKLDDRLKKIDISMQTYCYPYGEYCKESESMLKNLGYKMTLTCNEKINYPKNKQSLFLLNRINRSAAYANLNELLVSACNK